MTPDRTESGGMPGGGAREFRTTHWSVVLAARDPSLPGASAALESLCRSYWYPLYSFIRRDGRSPHDAQDLTQEFLARLIHRNHLHDLGREGGKFRSFLLATLKHFLSDERKRANAQKRGGGQTPISIDEALAEERYGLEPATDPTPDRLFDQGWALAVLERAVARLRQEYAVSGRAGLFERLSQFQPGEAVGQSYAEVAAELGLSESAVKSAIHRLRARHRELLREEVGQTLADPSELDAELRHLLSVL